MSKKSCKSAVGRNRLKRLIRESFRHSRSQLPGVDVVVLTTPAARLAAAAELRASLAGHWQKVKRQCVG